jgi:hypothetical protein
VSTCLKRMRVLLLALPMTVLALGCGLTHRATIGSTEAERRDFQCTPELEGRFVEGSSGVWLNVPFTGTLLRRTGDGQPTPAVYASISIASEPCPRGKPHELQLNSGGHFEEKFDLETDTHGYCRGGKVESEELILPIRLRITSPGCDYLELAFSGEAGPHALQLSCATRVVSEEPSTSVVDVSHRVGARIELFDGVLSMDGARVALPAEAALLTRVLGVPSQIVRAVGDQYSDDVYEWETSGVFGFARPNGSNIHALGFILAPELNSRQWCNPGTVRLTVNGVAITLTSRPSQLKMARFLKTEGDFEQRLNGIYATLLSTGEPPVYYELEVGVE